MNEIKNEEDEVVGEIHEIRAELLAEHNGSIRSLLKDLRDKQNASGKKVIERLNPAPSQLKAG